MSARNPFVTSFIYSPSAIVVIEEVLSVIVDDDAQFIGSRDKAGYFTGRMDTIEPPPFDLLGEILKEADKRLAEVGYKMAFDIAVVCDDNPAVILSRQVLMEIGYTVLSSRPRLTHGPYRKGGLNPRPNHPKPDIKPSAQGRRKLTQNE